jgi:hypothetical protein
MFKRSFQPLKYSFQGHYVRIVTLFIRVHILKHTKYDQILVRLIFSPPFFF